MRIGIMGGTFNPVHTGHLIMAQKALNQLNLDEVWFMPSRKPPHKKKSEIVSDFHRSNMIKLAISNNESFVFSNLELKREGTTYTADTLLDLKERYPKDSFWFIMGEDSFVDLEKWNRPEVVCKLANIAVVPRFLNKETESIDCYKIKYEKKYAANIYPLDMPRIEISSTQIRKSIEEKQQVRYEVPDTVIQYMQKNKLYEDGSSDV